MIGPFCSYDIRVRRAALSLTADGWPFEGLDFEKSLEAAVPSVFTQGLVRRRSAGSAAKANESIVPRPLQGCRQGEGTQPQQPVAITGLASRFHNCNPPPSMPATTANAAQRENFPECRCARARYTHVPDAQISANGLAKQHGRPRRGGGHQLKRQVRSQPSPALTIPRKGTERACSCTSSRHGVRPVTDQPQNKNGPRDAGHFRIGSGKIRIWLRG